MIATGMIPTGSDHRETPNVPAEGGAPDTLEKTGQGATDLLPGQMYFLTDLFGLRVLTANAYWIKISAETTTSSDTAIRKRDGSGWIPKIGNSERP